MSDNLDEFIAAYGKEHLAILSDGELTIDEMTLYWKSVWFCLQPLGQYIVTQSVINKKTDRWASLRHAASTDESRDAKTWRLGKKRESCFLKQIGENPDRQLHADHQDEKRFFKNGPI